MGVILVIEDEPPVQDNIRQILEFEGYHVIAASDGLQGVQAAREELPDLIICDIMLPELDGYEVLHELSQDLTTATIPFIFLTARTERQDVRKGMELGADDYITKPFSSAELVKAVQTRLEKQRILEKERLQAISRRLVALQETERRHIVAELNGPIGDLLTGLKVMLTMHRRLPEQAATARFDDMHMVIDEIITRIDTLSNWIRPKMLDELGILPTLLQYFNSQLKQSGLDVAFRHKGLDQRFSQEVETAVYRLVHEALSNVVLHAGTHAASVTIWVDHDILSAQIEDRGVGFAVDVVTHNGRDGSLASLHEHLGLIGGTLSIVSSPGAGTQVLATLPLSREDDSDAEPAVSANGGASHDLFRSAEPARARVGPPRRRAATSAGARYSVVLADKNALTRQGLGHLLDADHAFTVAAETGLADDTIHKVKELEPDVVIIDWEMGLDTITYVADHYPETAILVLSRVTDEAYVTEAMQAGASGYALKDSSPEEIIEAVHHVASGQRYLSPFFSERAIEAYLSNRQASIEASTSFDMLTDREQEVFRMVVDGYRNREIAKALYISPRTVETHRANMMRKLGLRNQADLLRYALQRGLASAEG